MENKAELFREKGPTTTIIDAEITENGDLLISGVDYGEAPLEHFHDFDYEYWLTIPSSHKEETLLFLMNQAKEKSQTPQLDGQSTDKKLLGLLQMLYSDNISVVSLLRYSPEKLGIPVKFHSY